MSSEIIKTAYSKITCENCGEEMDSWDPLENHILCSMCKMRASQIYENAKRELRIFGEMRRKVRETKKQTDEARREKNAAVIHGDKNW